MDKMVMVVVCVGSSMRVRVMVSAVSVVVSCSAVYCYGACGLAGLDWWFGVSGVRV